MDSIGRRRRSTIYQVIDGQQVEIAGRFVVLDPWTCSFEVTGDYDPNRELVVDPNLAWSTYLGGSNWDCGNAIALDSVGTYWSLEKPNRSAGFPAGLIRVSAATSTTPL